MCSVTDKNMPIMQAVLIRKKMAKCASFKVSPIYAKKCARSSFSKSCVPRCPHVSTKTDFSKISQGFHRTRVDERTKRKKDFCLSEIKPGNRENLSDENGSDATSSTGSLWRSREERTHGKTGNEHETRFLTFCPLPIFPHTPANFNYLKFSSVQNKRATGDEAGSDRSRVTCDQALPLSLIARGEERLKHSFDGSHVKRTVSDLLS